MAHAISTSRLAIYSYLSKIMMIVILLRKIRMYDKKRLEELARGAREKKGDMWSDDGPGPTIADDDFSHSHDGDHCEIGGK